MRKQLKALIVVAVMASLMVPTVLAATSTQRVDNSDLGNDWNEVRDDAGQAGFVVGPATAPSGAGSYQMVTHSSSDKVTLFTYTRIGTKLADIDAMGYATYRDSSSTNSSVQYPAINIEIDYVGDGSSYATLIFEPTYNPGQGSLLTDTWQTWDAFDGGNAIWWSSKNIPGVCAFNCFVSWDTIVTNNPNAKIKYGVGVNAGSGWNGDFLGAVDAYAFGANGDTVVYDFEPILQPDLCANRYNGSLRLPRRDCSSTETAIYFPLDAPIDVCVNRYNGTTRYTRSGRCGRTEYVRTIQGDGSFPVCINRYNSEIRAPRRQGQCGRTEYAATL